MIRPASVADIWALRRKAQRRIFFYTDALLASSYHSYILSLRSIVEPMSSDRKTLVSARPRPARLLAGAAVAGCAEADLAIPRLVWSTLTVAPERRRSLLSTDRRVSACAPGNERMQRRLCDARRPIDRCDQEVLRQLGFQPYAQQIVWMLNEPVVEAGSSMVALRRQNRRDAWAIQQLYTSTHAAPCAAGRAKGQHDPGCYRAATMVSRARSAPGCLAMTRIIDCAHSSAYRLAWPCPADHDRATPARGCDGDGALCAKPASRSSAGFCRAADLSVRAAVDLRGAGLRRASASRRNFVKQLALLKRQPVFRPSLLGNASGEGAIPASTVAAYNEDAEAP